MNTKRRSFSGLALLVFGLLTPLTNALAQDLKQDERREALARRATVQSELDYLRAAKLPISIELTQVTIKQAYAGIAGKAELSITYEGVVNNDAKHDVSFKGAALKDVLGELGHSFKLSYRVDGPAKLTVIGELPKPGTNS